MSKKTNKDKALDLAIEYRKKVTEFYEASSKTSVNKKVLNAILDNANEKRKELFEVLEKIS